MIAKSDIKKLSALARIELSGKEEDDLARDLGSILGYFEKLKEIPVGEISETADAANYPANFRDDEKPAVVFKNFSGLIAAAPESDQGYVKVKAVFQR
ncbi:MAG: Asp-tRNA(Asn)/Glu-tRNA(Gln) amidotransferase subunit GatC [Patescibacteria group bacterium]